MSDPMVSQPAGFTCGCQSTGHDWNCWTRKPARGSMSSPTRTEGWRRQQTTLLREIRDLLATISQQLGDR